MVERQYTCESKTKAAFSDQIINFKKQLRHYVDCHGAFTSGYYIDLIGLTKEIAAISSIDPSLSLYYLTFLEVCGRRKDKIIMQVRSFCSHALMLINSVQEKIIQLNGQNG